MKSFIKAVFATIVGMFIFCFFGAFLFIAIVAGIAQWSTSSISQEDEVTIDAPSVLTLKLEGQLIEKTLEVDSDIPLNYLVKDKTIGVLDVVAILKEAKEDKRIEGLSLRIGDIVGGLASIKELQDAFSAFKEEGKFIYAYADYLTEKTYALAATSDTLMVHPHGTMEFNGFVLSRIFFKELLDKIGIRAHVFRVGEYKSAPEGLIRNGMSEESREQSTSLLTDVYRTYLEHLEKLSGIDEDTLRRIASEMEVVSMDDATRKGLASQKGYVSDYKALLRKRLSLDKDEKIPSVPLRKYGRTLSAPRTKDKIAVIIAQGVIRGGKTSLDGDYVGEETFVKQLQQATEDKRVKAIVLRINSPGGSFMASDNMWKAILEAREEKPVIASLSDLAASGGYYLAMACDTVVAYAHTITGSIGIFLVSADMTKLQGTLGVRVDKVQTGRFADILSPSRPPTEEEKVMIQARIQQLYDVFATKTAAGRSMEVSQVDALGRGRVWSGTQAIENGLADMEGGFEDALRVAARQAGITEYRLSYPKIDVIDVLLHEIKKYVRLQVLGDYHVFLPRIQQEMPALDELAHIFGVQARLPYTLSIH